MEFKGCYVNRLLKESDVDKIFDDNSIFIGCGNAVPMEIADRLFGFNCEGILKLGEDYSIYGTGNNKPQIRYLKKRGFEKVVTYHNIRLFDKCIKEEQEEKEVL